MLQHDPQASKLGHWLLHAAIGNALSLLLKNDYAELPILEKSTSSDIKRC